MAITDGRITFLDFIRSLGPDGRSIMTVAEVLNQSNPMLQDGPILKSNADLGHRVTLRSGLPTVTTGKIDKGVPRSKSATEQRTESMALFVGRSEIDVRNKQTFGLEKYNRKRASEDLAFAESFSQFVTLQALYGSVNADEGTIQGIATRMPALQQPAYGVGASQVWSKGTVTGGDGTSIYIVDWGERGVHWIYPEASTTAGLQSMDKGEVQVNDVDGNPFFADVTEYDWSIGIAVEDPRHIGRLANIDISDALLGTGMVQGRLTDSLMDVIGAMPAPDGMQRIIYAPGRLVVGLNKQLNNLGAGVPLTVEEYLGKRMLHFQGSPFRQVDQISLSETTVS
jgi:hypothetical protein